MAASTLGVVTADEKQLLLERYLDIEWLDDVTEIKCVRCDRVPIQHYVSNCMHLFCRNCRTVFSDGGHWKCPKCREYVTELSDQDWQLEDTIYQIRAHCPNMKYGCHYQGQLSTIPGHLKSCKDTREAALPAEFKGITLDTVTNKILSLSDAIGEMRSELRESNDRSEAKWNELKERVVGLSSDLDRQRQQQADVEQHLKDVSELSDKCEDGLKQVKENKDVLSKDIQGLRWDVQEQKEQMAKVKPIIKEVKERCEGNWTRTQTMEKQLDKVVSTTEILSQRLNEQLEQATKQNEILNGMKDKDSRGELEIGQLRTQLHQQQTQITQDSNRLTTVNANVGEVQSALRELKVTWQKKWTDVNKHTAEVKDTDARLEIQQLRTQLRRLEASMKTP